MVTLPVRVSLHARGWPSQHCEAEPAEQARGPHRKAARRSAVWRARARRGRGAGWTRRAGARKRVQHAHIALQNVLVMHDQARGDVRARCTTAARGAVRAGLLAAERRLRCTLLVTVCAIQCVNVNLYAAHRHHKSVTWEARTAASTAHTPCCCKAARQRSAMLTAAVCYCCPHSHLAVTAVFKLAYHLSLRNVILSYMAQIAGKALMINGDSVSPAIWSLERKQVRCLSI